MDPNKLLTCTARYADESFAHKSRSFEMQSTLHVHTHAWLIGAKIRHREGVFYTPFCGATHKQLRLLESTAALVCSRSSGVLIVESPPQQTREDRATDPNTFPCHSITTILLMAANRDCVSVQACDVRLLHCTLSYWLAEVGPNL